MIEKNVKNPAGYKDSPLGVIPAEWEVKKLGDICTKIGSGVTPKGGEAVYSVQGHFFIRSQNVGWGQLLLDDVAYIDDEIHKKQIATELKYKDVLLNITGASIGRSATVSDDIVGGNVNQHVCIIRPKSILDSDFLCLFLVSSQGQKMIDSYQAGGNRQGLNFEQIRSFIFPLPPLPEQQRIAEVLGTWDQGIELQAKLIESLQKRKRALMQQLLTGKKRLKGFDQAWKKVKLGEIGYTYNGLTGKSKEDFEKGDSNYIPYINIFNNGKIDLNNLGSVDLNKEEKQNKANFGDVFFTVSSETSNEIGMSSVLLANIDNLYLNSFCFGYRLYDFNSLIPEFAVYFFRAITFRKKMIVLAQGSTRYNISKTEVLKLLVDLPPLPEQQAIAEILTAADREIELAQKKLEVLREQKRGLMQQLLTGKKRLKV